jgi:hypothetical protein
MQKITLPAMFMVWTIQGPIADAGPDQYIKGNELVQLDGSNNSSNPDVSAFNYSGIKPMGGPEVNWNDAITVNQIFSAPITTT